MRICSAFSNHHTILLIAAFAFVAVCIFSISLSDAGLSRAKISHSVGSSSLTNINLNSSFVSRKLLKVGTVEGGTCANEDVVVSQEATTSLPNGIPVYTVQIMNLGRAGCPIAGIHLTCGWFSSARLINPKIFRRLEHNDCLVNDGKPLEAGCSISFQYVNSFQYPLSVSSVNCVSH